MSAAVRRPVLLALPIVSVFCSFAHCADHPERPNFTGNWVLDLTRSRLEIEAPDTTVFEITHNDPVWRVKRTHVYGGKPETRVSELTIGAAEALKTPLKQGTETSRLAWNKDKLELTLHFQADSGSEWDVFVRYHLLDDGQTFVAEETMRSSSFSYDNRWVFRRIK